MFVHSHSRQQQRVLTAFARGLRYKYCCGICPADYDRSSLTCSHISACSTTTSARHTSCCLKQFDSPLCDDSHSLRRRKHPQCFGGGDGVSQQASHNRHEDHRGARHLLCDGGEDRERGTNDVLTGERRSGKEKRALCFSDGEWRSRKWEWQGEARVCLRLSNKNKLRTTRKNQ